MVVIYAPPFANESCFFCVQNIAQKHTLHMLCYYWHDFIVQQFSLRHIMKEKYVFLDETRLASEF